MDLNPETYIKMVQIMYRLARSFHIMEADDANAAPEVKPKLKAAEDNEIGLCFCVVKFLFLKKTPKWCRSCAK